jgi:type II secretory pathway pseudopilin PulG
MTPQRNQTTRTKAFTLLELIIVAGILSTVAGGAILLIGPAEEQARSQMSQVELSRLRDAILQFHTDTASLPKQGPFSLTSDGGSVPVPAEGATWFYHPANFEQLYENPLAGTGHALETWNPDTKRGWRGPYISSFGEGYVDIGDGLLPDGTGDPAAGNILPELKAIADPFITTSSGNYFVWRFQAGDTPAYQWGRPYLLIDANNEATARVIGLGSNRKYDLGTSDDYVFKLF